MSIQIKNLTVRTENRTADGRVDAPGSTINRIRLDNNIYDLYTAPSPTTENRAAIVKGMRITNTHTAAIIVNVFYTENVVTGGVVDIMKCCRRRVCPKDLVLQPGFTYIEDGELTMEPGSRIQASARPETGTAPASLIDYLICGVERDVS